MQVDGDLKQRLADTVCPRCGGEGGAFALVGLDYPHFGRVLCAASCADLIQRIQQGDAHYIEWLQAPKELAKARRRTKAYKVTDATDRCEICLRGPSELHEPAKLTVHHVVEVQHEGEDDDSNRRIYCSDCQSIVHTLRRAFGRPYAE